MSYRQYGPLEYVAQTSVITVTEFVDIHRMTEVVHHNYETTKPPSRHQKRTNAETRPGNAPGSGRMTSSLCDDYPPDI